MAFESLSDKLTEAFKRLRGKGRLTEADVKEAMREVKLALLEADVNFKVVKDFVRKVTERATGADVLESLSPAQMVIKIVNGTSSELAEMLLDHRTDFCLISHRDSLPVWLPIRQDELMVLLPKNHPLADRESFPVESLKTEPFIDSYPGMETDITLIFDKLKARPDARYSTMDITATYAMVSAGLGISVNNAINDQDGYPGVVERPMNPHQMMEIGLACGENLAPAAQAFLDFVKERLPE